MPDFRVADTAPEHPKLRAVGLAPFGLWAAAGAYAMRELTDGWVPEYWVNTWPSGRRHAKALLDVGLWSKEPRQGIAGYSFHDWDDYQRSADQVHTERARGRERAARSAKAKHAGHSSRNGRAAREAQPKNERSYADSSPEASGEASTEASPEEDPKLQRSFAAPYPYPYPSPLRGDLVGGRPVGNAGASRNGPRPRCPEHANLPADEHVPACGACKQLRLDAEQHAADAQQQRADAAAERRAAVAACGRCDEQGWTDTDAGLTRCDHAPVLRAVRQAATG